MSPVEWIKSIIAQLRITEGHIWPAGSADLAGVPRAGE
jgi:hypothetical protein